MSYCYCFTNVQCNSVSYSSFIDVFLIQNSCSLWKSKFFVMDNCSFQMTSESLVSRPFSGKICLAQYKGNWSRVEVKTGWRKFNFFVAWKFLGHCILGNWQVYHTFSDHYSHCCSFCQITNMYGNRLMEILFIDLGVPATVEVTDLREIPPLFLQDLTIIPPQVSCLFVCACCGRRWMLLLNQTSCWRSIIVIVHWRKRFCLC